MFNELVNFRAKNNKNGYLTKMRILVRYPFLLFLGSIYN